MQRCSERRAEQSSRESTEGPPCLLPHEGRHTKVATAVDDAGEREEAMSRTRGRLGDEAALDDTGEHWLLYFRVCDFR